MEHCSHLVADTASPIELLANRNPLVTNIIDGQVAYDFHMPVTALRNVAALIMMLARQLCAHPGSTGRKRAGNVTDHHAFPLIMSRLRIILNSHANVDSTYILNANNEHGAVVYYYLSHEQRAIRIKERTTAQHHAQQLHMRIRDDHDGIIYYAHGVDRGSSHNELRTLLAGHSGNDIDVSAFLSESGLRRPPASKGRDKLGAQGRGA